jgi:hypothetical protein
MEPGWRLKPQRVARFTEEKRMATVRITPHVNVSAPSIKVEGEEDKAGSVKQDSHSVLQASIQKARLTSGIPERHMALLQGIAAEHKSIIAMRPVERHNTSLILAGYPTKGLQIKGKSANWGPHYGFICVDQRFSKLRGRSAEKIQKANDSVQDCLRDNHAQAIDLHLPPERLDYLIQNGLLLRQGGGDRFTLLAKPAQSGDPEFTAERLPGGDLRILADNQPLRVLAPALLKHAAKQDFKQRPFTADYDMLAVMPQWSDFTSQNIRRPASSAPASPRLSPADRATTLPIQRSRSAIDLPRALERQQSAPVEGYVGKGNLSPSRWPISRTPSVTDLAGLFEQHSAQPPMPRSLSPSPRPDMPRIATDNDGRASSRRGSHVTGLVDLYDSTPRPATPPAGPVDNVSEHEKRIADSINLKLREECNSSAKTGYESAWQLVHHGSDEGNPASDEADNYPATVFLPHSIGEFAPVTVLHTPQDLARLVKTVTDNGFHFEGNKHWPLAKNEAPVARKLNDIERRVSSTNLAGT